MFSSTHRKLKKSFASLSQDTEGHFHSKLQKTLVLTKTWSKIIVYPSFYISASLFLYYYLLSFYTTESTYCLRHKCRKYLGIHTKEKKTASKQWDQMTIWFNALKALTLSQSVCLKDDLLLRAALSVILKPFHKQIERIKVFQKPKKRQKSGGRNMNMLMHTETVNQIHEQDMKQKNPQIPFAGAFIKDTFSWVEKNRG